MEREIKQKQIWKSLAEKEYRDALSFEHSNVGLAFQIRRIRIARGLSQSDLADRLGKSLKTIERWEDPDYEWRSITNLWAVASVFDVALIVKFVSFSDLVEGMVNLSEGCSDPPSFGEENKEG